MNIIEALRDWNKPEPEIELCPTDEYISATDYMETFLAQYDALAPNWNEAPAWAQWYAIDADGSPCWHESEPQQEPTHVWDSEQYLYTGDVLELLLGIDWRVCKFERPEVKP